MTDWSAPFRGKHGERAAQIKAVITIPGSKSVTNRALILAALSDSPSRLIRPLHSRDTDLMVAGLRALGIKIDEISNDDGDIWEVTPGPLFGPAAIDVGNAGTVMRFMLPVASLANGLIHFDGDPRSHERPLAPLIKALEDLGVTIDHKNRYALPLLINGAGRISGGEVSLDASKSSQFLSALLLAGARMEKGLKVTHTGATLPSQPHIDMTIAMLREFGAFVEINKNNWRISPGKPNEDGLHGREIVIEPDLSNAAPFMAAPIISGGEVIIRDWPRQTSQPGDQLRSIFSKMGGAVEFVDEGLKVSGTGVINGIDIDLRDVGELTPSIAALASLAHSPSYLRGIGHLRLHETDRLAALAREINSLGGSVVEEPEALRINPAPLHSGKFHTYEDHRLATAGALLGLAVPGIVVENIETTQKTLPNFPQLWNQLLESNT